MVFHDNDLAKLQNERDQLVKDKNQAYKERNALVALLSKMFPSALGKHDETDELWDDAWRNIVFIDLPDGQCSWHIHDTELPNFAHLIPPPGVAFPINWDGHTTEEKYERVAAATAEKILNLWRERGCFNGLPEWKPPFSDALIE